MLKAPASPKPPLAARKDHMVSHHGDRFNDPYNWLRDPGYPEVTDEDVLAYLRAENEYFDTVMKPVAPVIDTLFEEIKGRIKEDEESVPWQDGGFDYRWAFRPGAQYRTWYRRPRSADPFAGDGWSVLFDEPVEAEGSEFFKLGALEVSPDGSLLAFSADKNGSERFTVNVRHIASGTLLDITVEETSGELVWAADGSGFFYVRVSKEWRPYLVRFVDIKTGQSRDVFEEQDTSFFVHIGHTSTRRHLVIRSADHVTAENRVLDLGDVGAQPICIAARQTGHDYSVDGDEAGFVIRSNREEKNFCIYRAPYGSTSADDWALLLRGDDSHYIHGMHAFKRFLALEERVNGLDQVRLLGTDGSDRYIAFPEAVYEAGFGTNPEYDQAHLRIGYSSLVTPPTMFDYDIATRALVVRKEQEIPSGYDKAAYEGARLMVTARDGTRVPVSLVYKKGWKKGQGAPLHLYGYGAYGLGMSPGFSAARLSLLDRGFAYAIAHIRGGDELGYHWYEAGKLERRTNTFNDFVDVARHLECEGYAAPGGISISGGSAGGELMGAVIEQAPELFAGAVLHVPFVDVLNTMLDDSLPLTPIEWPEWGNPLEDADAYAHIRSYCPYFNIAARDYPPMLVTGGLHDPRVTYWEPAKWTARMRATKTDDNLLVMKINMGAGHGGKSGRYERYHEVAEEYAFLLMCFGLEK